MRIKSVVALRPGDVIVHDGSSRLSKSVEVKSVSMDGARIPAPSPKDVPVVPQTSRNVVVNDSLIFHKTWEVTVK